MELETLEGVAACWVTGGGGGAVYTGRGPVWGMITRRGAGAGGAAAAGVTGSAAMGAGPAGTLAAATTVSGTPAAGVGGGA